MRKTNFSGKISIAFSKPFKVYYYWRATVTKKKEIPKQNKTKQKNYYAEHYQKITKAGNIFKK